MKRLWLVLLVAVAVVASSTSIARAAAPRIVIISGKPLAHQVVISDWETIFSIVGEFAASRAAPRAQFAHRPKLKVSMFWGPRWNDYVSSGKPAAALRPKQADQFGSFYPAWRERPAMIDLPWAGRTARPRRWPRANRRSRRCSAHRPGLRRPRRAGAAAPVGHPS